MDSMKQLWLHKFVAGSLLLYFALFIIPPVSSLASASGGYALHEDMDTLAQDHRYTRLYLVDIFLWLTLKQSRHTEALSVIPHDQAASGDAVVPADTLSALLPEQLQQLLRSARSLRRSVSGHLSRSADIFFARSGIAPPFLS